MLGTMLSAYTCGHMSSSQALCAAGTAPRPIFTAEETEAQNADVVSSQTTLSLPVGALVKWRVVPTAGPPPRPAVSASPRKPWKRGSGSTPDLLIHELWEAVPLGDSGGSPA